MVDTPFFLRPYRSSIDAAKKRIEEARLREEILKAQNAAQPKPKKGLFDRAIKGISGFVPDAIESPAKAAGKATLSGLETWGNQVQSVPAALFTEGIVEDGQYTTRRNIIGNPFQNVASHVAAQRQAGVAPESSGGLFGDIKAGFASARKAGEAYQADPDIPMGIKTATGIGLDPTTYVGAGLLSKAPKIAAVGGAKGKALRAPLSILEGFENPAQVARFTAGAAAGSQLAENYGIPGVGEGVEQLVGSMGGGIGGLLAGKRGGFLQTMKDVDPALAKLQGREGKPAAIGMMTETVFPEERLSHTTPNFIPEGEIIISPWGDQGPGFHLSRDEDRNSEAYKYGDSKSYKDDYWGDRKWPEPEKFDGEVPSQTYRFKAKRPLQLLLVDENLLPAEFEQIRRVAPPEWQEAWDYRMKLGMKATGATVLDSLKEIVGRNEAVGDVLNSAGFDGMASTQWVPGKAEQITVFRPNEVLETDLTAPTFDYGPKKAMLEGNPPVNNPQPTNISKFPSPVPMAKYETAMEQAKVSAAEPTHPLQKKAENLIELKTQGIITSQEFIDDWESAKASYNTAGNSPKIEIGQPKIKYNQKKYDEMLFSLSDSERKKYYKLAAEKGLHTNDDYMQFLTEFHSAVKGTPQVENKIDTLSHGPDTYMKQWEKEYTSLSPADQKSYNDWLNSPQGQKFEGGLLEGIKKYKHDNGLGVGPDEFDDLVPPTAFPLKSPEGYNYSYEPMSGQLMIEGADEPIFIVKKDSLTGDYEWFDNSTGEIFGNKSIAGLVDNIADVVDIEPPLSELGKALKAALMKDEQNAFNAPLPKTLDDILSGLSEFKKPQPKPITPEEIIGTSTTKDSEAFIKEIETGLGKPNEFKSYAPQGQPGAPVAGVANVGKVVKEQLESSGFKPGPDPNPMTVDQKIAASYEYPDKATPEDITAIKNKKEAEDFASLTPAQQAKYKKLQDGLLGPGFKNAPHSVLMKEAKKSTGIFGNIGGGAMPEVLVTPKEIQVGLTTGEKVANAITKVRRFITGSGVANNEVATPIAREYVRINRVLKTQAITIGKMAERAEKMLGISTVDDMVNLDNLSSSQKQIVESLQRSMEAFDETLNQFDAEFDSIHDFVAKIREEEGFENKDFSDILTEYGNAIANKVSDTWLQGEIKKIAGAIDLSAQAGKKIPTSTVSVAKDIKLPRAVGSVLEEAFHKVHPTKSPAYAELFTAINNQLRGMWAAGDASFQGIQMLPTWVDNPKAAYQATKIGFETLKDHTVMADFIRRHDEVRYGTGKPTVTEYVRNGLHIAHALGEGTDLGGISERIQNIKGYGTFLKKSNTMFTDTGNANRIMIADYLWDQYQNGGISMLTGIPLKGGTKVGAKEGMTRAQILEAIGEAANRATGYSHRGFGGPYGAALFFAPRFMQSQIEMVAKAAYGNKLENQVARRQLAKLIAMGSALTVAINEISGEETVFDPRDSNFMRIRNVGGLDISVFGPWDTLIRGVVKSAPQIGEDGNITLGDPTYLLRSKLSPVLSTATDWITGENVIGQNSRTLEAAFKNTFLPFSAREIGEESLLATGFGAIGAKASPLTGSEKLENELANAGIEKSDPDYLIKRREYLAANPDSVPESQSKEFKRAQEIQKEIADRRKANDDLASSSQITLTEFRENRKILLTEQRNRLNEVLSKDIKNADSKQREWLNSYFELFDDETNKDFITGEIDPDAFDTAVAQWANQNGTQALEFVNKYMGAGLNPVERAYYNDMRKLEAAGYFDVPKYHRMQSGLTEDEIDSLARTVDSFRAANPDLSEQAWATTAKRVLKESLTNEEILDIIRSRKEAFQNPQREELKRQFGRETLWFNSRADWSSYTNYKPGSNRTARSRRERRSRQTANVGGILKKTIGA